MPMEDFLKYQQVQTYVSTLLDYQHFLLLRNMPVIDLHRSFKTYLILQSACIINSILYSPDLCSIKALK